MSLSLKPQHLKRYRDIIRLFIKFGRSDLVKKIGLEQILTEDERLTLNASDPKAEELTSELEQMGPVFIKLGQLLSTRPDLLPIPYLRALSRLQDEVGPFPVAEVEEIISSELGVRISKIFLQFDPVPLAAASLGQVHRGILRDNRLVAVKIQRPGIRRQMADDFEVLADVAEFLDRHTEAGRRYHFLETLEEFRKNLVRELDYRHEARNMAIIGERLKNFPEIVIPRPIDDLTTSRVLIMDYIHGRKITSLSPLARTERNGSEFAEILFRAYLQQILIDGLFHADPHPGNVFLTDDGRIALLDLGMVGQIPPGMQERLFRLLLAVSEGRGEEAADLAIRMGQIQDDFNEPAFKRRMTDLVIQQHNATVKEMEIGRLIMEIARISARSGIRVPTELTMLGKTLMSLDEVGRTLNPEFDPNESIRRNATRLMNQRILKSVSSGNLFGALADTKDFLRELPLRISQILEKTANNELRVQVDAIDETHLLEGFQKVANRITVGLVLAALIIGAALLMRVETSFKILGYPGFAIIFFLAAASGGFWMVISTLIHDRAVHHRKHHR